MHGNVMGFVIAKRNLVCLGICNMRFFHCRNVYSLIMQPSTIADKLVR